MITLFLQTATPNPISSETINQVQAVVNTMASDAFPKAFVFLCLIVVLIFLFLTLVVKIFEKLLSKTEYIKLGFLTFKNKNNTNDETKTNINTKVHHIAHNGHIYTLGSDVIEDNSSYYSYYDCEINDTNTSVSIISSADASSLRPYNALNSW